jgi:transcriptional regulator with XRE-family HTH domain
MDKKAFGRLLLRKREDAAKSVEEYAGQLDLSPITLRRWEDGLYAPRNNDQYKKIASVYGLSKVELLSYTGVSISDTVEGADKDTDLLPLLKLIAETKLQTLDQDGLNHLIRAFCKSDGTDFDPKTIEVLIRFRD